MTTVFSKIIAGEIPSERVYEDDQCIVIRDIHPQSPVHLLCIPKRVITDLSVVEPEDKTLLGHLLWVVSHVATEHGLKESGYRVVINYGRDGGMEVPHLHLHLLGGKKLPPLG